MIDLMGESYTERIAENEFLSLGKNRHNFGFMLKCIDMLKDLECLKEVPCYYYGNTNELIFALFISNLHISVELNTDDEIILACIEYDSTKLYGFFISEYSIEAEAGFKELISKKLKKEYTNIE